MLCWDEEESTGEAGIIKSRTFLAVGKACKAMFLPRRGNLKQLSVLDRENLQVLHPR